MKWQIGKLLICWGWEPCRKLKLKRKEDAEKYAARLMKNRGWVRYVYHCKECNAWHLTKMPQHD